jgi:hypothetical protein
VLVMEKGRTIIVLPDGAADLGVVTPQDKIEVSRAMTAAGPRWQARVIAA